MEKPKSINWQEQPSIFNRYGKDLIKSIPAEKPTPPVEELKTEPGNSTEAFIGPLNPGEELLERYIKSRAVTPTVPDITAKEPTK